MKADHTQLDDRVVEVHWDPRKGGWKFMRFRDDKPEGNHRTVVDKIVQSIVDGIEQDEVSSSSFHHFFLVCSLSLPLAYRSFHSCQSGMESSCKCEI